MNWKDNFPRKNRYFETDNGILYWGDNLELLKLFTDNIIDTVITDPPYGLRFMGHKWDYNVPSVEFWKELLRVVKPGATLLSFAGSKTQHRMAVNIEDTGFILKDTLMWLYGQGFPKGYDIAKGIDAKIKTGKTNPKAINLSERSKDTGEKIVKIQPNNGILGDKKAVTKKINAELETELAKKWNGYKSHCLKPAYEPIIMVMKKNEGTYVDNAIKWEVSGLNIDKVRLDVKPRKTGTKTFSNAPTGTGNTLLGSSKEKQINYDKQNKGRFPANVLLDEFAANMLDGWSKTKTVGFGKFGGGKTEYYGAGKKDKTKSGASRFFYVAKAGKSEKNLGCEDLEIPTYRWNNGGKMKEIKGRKGNFHPTVKPIKLIEYLIKLTLMPNKNQIYLDPFTGSGTTAIACEKLNRRWIGIELNPEYCKIAKKRIEKFTMLNKGEK